MDLNQHYTQRRNEFFAKQRELIEPEIIQSPSDQVSTGTKTLHFDVEDLITGLRNEYIKKVQPVLDEGLLVTTKFSVIQAAQDEMSKTLADSKYAEVINAYFEFRLKHLFYYKTYPDGEILTFSDL